MNPLGMEPALKRARLEGGYYGGMPVPPPPPQEDVTGALQALAGQVLANWFAEFGGSPAHEIEARVKGINPDVFKSIVANLDSNPVREIFRKGHRFWGRRDRGEPKPGPVIVLRCRVV